MRILERKLKVEDFLEARRTGEVIIRLKHGPKWSQLWQEPDAIYPFYQREKALFDALHDIMKQNGRRGQMLFGPSFIYAKGFAREELMQAIEQARPSIEAVEGEYQQNRSKWLYEPE